MSNNFKTIAIAAMTAIAACLAVEAIRNIAPANAQDLQTASSARILAVGGQVAKDIYGIYLVDVENGTICLYQYVPASKKLKLTAARTFVYDRRLDEYNTEPLPREIKQLIEQSRRLAETQTQPASEE